MLKASFLFGTKVFEKRKKEKKFSIENQKLFLFSLFSKETFETQQTKLRSSFY